MTKHIRMRSSRGSSVYIKDGFSWPAFFFGPIWALVKSAWLQFFILLISFGVLIVIDELVVRPSKNILLICAMLAAYIGYMVVCGKNGNAWLRRNLEREGYSRVEVTDA